MSRIYICLGKTGDVINAIPMLHADAQAGKRSALMIAEPYADVMQGVTYADCIRFPGSGHEIHKAAEHAKTLSDDVKCIQVVGPPELVKRYTYEPAKQDCAVTDSFQKEAWHIAGRLGDFSKSKLIFDNRSKEREQVLIDKYVPKKKKLMLVSLGGASSPFKYRELLLELLTLRFKTSYDLLDIGQLKCERIYDLLGLYEKATCLVSTDSAPLHLAKAVKIPTVALVNDVPSLWHGSVWRDYHIAHVRYGDFLSRFRDILEAIASLGKPGCFTKRTGEATIVHAWSGYDLTEESKARHERAKENWRVLYGSGGVACGVEVGAIGRDSKTHLKEDHRFPFVKDVIRLACQRAKDGDFILLTRHDSELNNSGEVSLPAIGVPYFSRRVIDGKAQNYIDLFHFPKSWWLEHQHEYPDMIMGRDVFWGKVLAELIKLHGGQEVRGLCWREPGALITLDKQPAYYGYNQHHAQEFLAKHGLVHKSKPVSAQANTVTVNPPILPRFSYNPSLLRWRNRLLMSFRYHIAGTLSTSLGIAELDDKLQVQKWSQLRINDGNPAHSYEDARLFVFRDQLWISYVESMWPKKYTCISKHAELFEDSRGWRTATPYQPRYGKNDFTGLEKNFCPFEADGKLHMVYDSRTILELDADYCTEIKGEPVSWEYGEIRGGAIIPYYGKLLRIFHSRKDDEMPPYPWKYYVGALLMEPEPPFNIIKVNPRPLLEGSEEGGSPDCFHFKPKVVFPCGCVPIEGGILVAVGINDSESAIVRLTDQQIGLI